MNLLIVKKLNHPHTTKERKFVNQVNAAEKKKRKETKIANKYWIRYVTKISP